MMYLNRAQIIGRLTQDPELRQTGGGQSVCSFSVATNRSWKDQSGETKEQAEFHNLVAWGKLAEIASNYLKKGRRVYVEGRIQTRSWEDNNGQKHWKTEIIAENLIMLDSKNEGGGGSSYSNNEEKSSQSEDFSPTPASSGNQDDDVSIEDVPF